MEAQAARRSYRMTARAEAADVTARRVLDVALRLFTDNPYDDGSLERVAAEAGVAKRTVLRRFGSKEALFGAAMSVARDEMIDQRQEGPGGDGAAGGAGGVRRA